MPTGPFLAAMALLTAAAPGEKRVSVTGVWQATLTDSLSAVKV